MLSQIKLLLLVQDHIIRDALPVHDLNGAGPVVQGNFLESLFVAEDVGQAGRQEACGTERQGGTVAVGEYT